MPDDLNPYAPPEARLEPSAAPSDDPPPTEAEAIRLASLQHERFTRALGPASFAAAFMVVLNVVFFGFRFRELLEASVWGQIPYIAKVMYIARGFVVPPLMIGLHLTLGFAFRKLEPWARNWQIGLSAAVLIAFTVNRVLTPRPIFNVEVVKILAFGVAHVVILYGLIGAKGASVFSEEYQKTIEATPRITGTLGPALMTVAIIGGLAASWGDDSVAEAIARHFATRVMGANPEP